LRVLAYNLVDVAECWLAGFSANHPEGEQVHFAFCKHNIFPVEVLGAGGSLD